MTRKPGWFYGATGGLSCSLGMRHGLLLILLASTVLLQGCFFDRLVTLRSQACSFNENFAVSIDQKLSFEFYSPVLLEKDLRLIWGAEPTSVLRSDSGATMRYLFERVPVGEYDRNTSALDEISLEFEFIPVDGQLRLSKISSSDLPAEMLLVTKGINLSGVDDIAAHACAVKVNPLTRSVRLPLDQTWFNDLPARDELLALLGSPNALSGNGAGLVYEYRLKGDDTESDIARMVIHYDDTGEIPLTVKARFNRYQMRTDLRTALMEVQFTI